MKDSGSRGQTLFFVWDTVLTVLKHLGVIHLWVGIGKLLGNLDEMLLGYFDRWTSVPTMKIYSCVIYKEEVHEEFELCPVLGTA